MDAENLASGYVGIACVLLALQIPVVSAFRRKVRLVGLLHVRAHC